MSNQIQSFTDRIEAAWVLDGPLNGESFRTYVDQVLVRTPKPGDAVMLDNSPRASHKGNAVRRAIRATGARLVFLPPYFPDLSPPLAAPRSFAQRSLWLAPPIEQVFAKLRLLLRKAEERTVDATWKRTGLLLESFTSG